MRRPWHSYPLLFFGYVALLGALFRPVFGVTSTAPGAAVVGAEQRLVVHPGSPLARAGVVTGDRFVSGETIHPSDPADGPVNLRWKRGIPKSGNLTVLRGEKRLVLPVQPAPLAWPGQVAWWITGLLNLALTAMALALFWQHPRDGRALLLGLVLAVAPVFSLPREPRLLPLALAAHFFAIFPASPAADTRRGRWKIAFRIYTPFVVFGLLGSMLGDSGNSRGAAAVFDLTAIGYALYCLIRVLRRWKEVDESGRPVIRTLTAAAAAMLAAVLAAVSERLWVVSDQFVPANLVPAAIFSGAMAHLVFRLRALEVRVVARRTLQYLFTRWTLGTLFLLPGFLLVWRLGQLSVSGGQGNPNEVLGYLLWMFVVSLLLVKRHQVLRNLDRRFFRDVEATRQCLIRLAQDLATLTDTEAVLNKLDRGVRQALGPESLRFGLPDGDTETGEVLAVPLRHGERVLGYLHLGPKASRESYSAEERGLLEAAAAQAASSLENARLHAELLARQREELTVRSAGVLAGAEEERRRLAADLHDQVLPELRQIVVDVERLERHANGLAPELRRVAGELRGAMDSVREVMEALRPSALDMLGLGDALESHFRKAAARRDPPLAMSVRRQGDEPALTAEQSLALYRICQEALNNVLKHSEASRAGLEIISTEQELLLCVWDDGRGLTAASPNETGHGVRNMKYRADLIGASVHWLPREEGGTRVEIRLPLLQAVMASG
jgi:signal transduction histidine kinase